MTLTDSYHTVLQYLRKAKFDQLADLLEKTYRHNPYTKDSHEWIMWLEQCVINLPILYLASIYLYVYGKQKGYQRYLFTTRDTCHWHRIFKRLFPETDVHYFRCSRNMFILGTEQKKREYQEYVKSMVNENSVYVDIHGTGRHMIDYFKKNFSYVIPCFFLSSGFEDYKDLPRSCRELHKEGKLHSVVLDVNGSPIEMLNYDRIGTLQDYTKHGPVLDPLEYDAGTIKPYHRCVQYFIDNLQPFSKAGDPKEPVDLRIIKKFLDGLFRPIQTKDRKPIISKYITHVRKHPRPQSR